MKGSWYSLSGGISSNWTWVISLFSFLLLSIYSPLSCEASTTNLRTIQLNSRIGIFYLHSTISAFGSYSKFSKPVPAPAFFPTSSRHADQAVFQWSPNYLTLEFLQIDRLPQNKCSRVPSTSVNSGVPPDYFFLSISHRLRASRGPCKPYFSLLIIPARMAERLPPQQTMCLMPLFLPFLSLQRAPSVYFPCPAWTL